MRKSDRFSWYYVTSDNMIADIGTRKGAKIKGVGPNSVWIMGFPLMGLSESEFPIKNISEISLSIEDNSEVNKKNDIGVQLWKCALLSKKYVPNQVGERYKFFRYLIDPNKYRFRTVIRILAVEFLFIQKISKNIIRSFKILENVQPCESNIGVYVVSLRHSHGSNLQPKVAAVHLSENILNSAKNIISGKQPWK